jgi:hypothetical protein
MHFNRLVILCLCQRRVVVAGDHINRSGGENRHQPSNSHHGEGHRLRMGERHAFYTIWGATWLENF